MDLKGLDIVESSARYRCLQLAAREACARVPPVPRITQTRVKLILRPLLRPLIVGRAPGSGLHGPLLCRWTIGPLPSWTMGQAMLTTDGTAETMSDKCPPTPATLYSGPHPDICLFAIHIQAFAGLLT